jgi:hypothetical protein
MPAVRRPREPVELPRPLAPGLGTQITGAPVAPAKAVRMGYDVYGRPIQYEVDDPPPDPGAPTSGMPASVLNYLHDIGMASVSVIHNHRRYLVQIGRQDGELRSFVYLMPEMRRLLARDHPRTHDALVARAEEQLIELASRCEERAGARKQH